MFFYSLNIFMHVFSDKSKEKCESTDWLLKGNAKSKGCITYFHSCLSW